MVVRLTWFGVLAAATVTVPQISLAIPMRPNEANRLSTNPPAFRVPCAGGQMLQLHVVELAKTDRNVPANDTVGGGLVFANPVRTQCRHGFKTLARTP